MDISKANTEPFFLLHLFHEEFNRIVRIAAGALGVVAQIKPQEKRRAKKVLRLPTLGEPWGDHTLWKDVVKGFQVPRDSCRRWNRSGVLCL